MNSAFCEFINNDKGHNTCYISNFSTKLKQPAYRACLEYQK